MQIASYCRRIVTRAASFVGAAALDFVYPPSCLLCGCEVGEQARRFCDSCWSKLKPRLTNDCPRCGAPVGAFADLTSGCGQCRKESFSFDRVIRLGVYDGEMRTACLRAKGNGGGILSRGLANALADEVSRKLSDTQLSLDLVLPIPEHWTRRVFHPHYAAETVAREVGRALQVHWSRTTLRKRRYTPKQATSSPQQRRRQQFDSFSVRKSATVTGKTILLIDDILTTGSTASAAARVLKQAGAKRVVVAVIAVSPLRK